MTPPPPGRQARIFQYGEMHEAIGQHKDQGRVLLSELVKRPHVYAVGALEHLRGEVTIVNGKITATQVDENGNIKSVEQTPRLQATMLVGAVVNSWAEHTVDREVGHNKFDTFIAQAASKSGIDTKKPFVFMVEGRFTNVRLHVIHGACPVHARMKRADLSPEEQPFEKTFDSIQGKLIGIYAEDAVGKLTHPATSTHAHILFRDSKTGEWMTAHVEQAGLTGSNISCSTFAAEPSSPFRSSRVRSPPRSTKPPPNRLLGRPLCRTARWADGPIFTPANSPPGVTVKCCV